MRDVNYYPHHIGDYARDTAHLSPLEDGIYRRMLDLYYATEKPLTDDREKLYRLLRLHGRECKVADALLEEFFDQAEGGGWRQGRCDAEIARAQEKRMKASMSAGKRWQSEGNANVHANASPPGMRTHSEGNAPNPNSQEPIAKEKRKSRARARATPLPEGFAISERVKAWAAAKGFGQLEKYLEFFIGRMKANGKTYTDWDEAFMNCIREDWPEFRKQNGSGEKIEPTCANCGGSLHAGRTSTDKGWICNPCWRAR